MRYVAFYVHSWFSWLIFLSLQQFHNSTNEKISYILILSRNFQLPKNNTEKVIQVIRFEQIENLYSSNLPYENFTNHIQSLLSPINEYPAVELLIPHVGYPPFSYLASSIHFKSVSFYQESLQIPDDTLIRRESDLLLSCSSSSSLYSTFNKPLNRKLNSNYYHALPELIPLHLNPILLPNLHSFISSLQSPIHLPAKIDFAILAGKAQNNPEGIKFFSTIYSVYRTIFPSSSILLKASPSSSVDMNNWMVSMSQSDDNVFYASGNQPIESLVCSSSISILFSEMFSLCGLAKLFSSDTTIISIDKTILHDYPSFNSILSSRISLKSYYHETMSQLCFSEFLLRTLQNK